MAIPTSKPVVPNLGYICLSKGVHFRLVGEEKNVLHIIYFQIFIHISVNIIFKNVLIVKCINFEA